MAKAPRLEFSWWVLPNVMGRGCISVAGMTGFARQTTGVFSGSDVYICRHGHGNVSVIRGELYLRYLKPACGIFVVAFQSLTPATTSTVVVYKISS